MTEDFARAASQNGVSITQQKWHIMNAKSNNFSNVFCHSLNNIGFLMKKKVVSTQYLKVHKREKFFVPDFEFFTIL